MKSRSRHFARSLLLAITTAAVAGPALATEPVAPHLPSGGATAATMSGVDLLPVAVAVIAALMVVTAAFRTRRAG